MGIFTKLKAFFSAAKENADNKLESFKEDKPVELNPAVIQPKGELIGNCILCHMAIGSEDRTKELNGHTCHKRCVKKAVKGMMNGKNLEGGV